MKLGSIPDPFSGEKVAAIYPRIASFVEQTPRLGRLHYFPGRHLTATALQREQTIRTDRLALRGRAVTHGVVAGLEVGSRVTTDGTVLQILPGHALTSGGLDLVVDRTVDAPIATIPLINPVTRGTSFQRPGAALTAVLVLQPGFIEDADIPLAARQESDTDFTPGPRVPEDEVYYKTTVTDASRLVLYPLPDNEPPGDLWQNRAAWSVFNREAEGLEIPWHDIGVPLALIGFDAAFEPEWIDRHAVVRPAGKPRQRVLIQPSFDARTWPARFDQFCAQLSTLANPVPATALFQFLPPIGLLPKSYLSLNNKAADGSFLNDWELTQRFFPAGYVVKTSVAPLEQLDALIADSIRLQPYDLSHLDAVHLILPISQQWFDPELLDIVEIAPAFAAAVARFRDARAAWLASRYDLASRRRVLELSIDEKFTPYPLTYTDADPKRLEKNEFRGTPYPEVVPEVFINPPPGDSDQYGTSRNVIDGVSVYASKLLAGLRNEADRFIKEFTREDIDEFGDTFKACGLPREPAAGEKQSDLEKVAKLLGEPEWLKDVTPKGTDQILLDTEKAELRRELIAYIEKQTAVQEEENRVADSASIQELIRHFEEKADDADELVEAGFLKARTDAFRLGHLLNNNSLGTKFSASPTLASIVERKPAKADGIAVNAFASQLLANFAPSATQTAANTQNAAPAAPAALDQPRVLTMMARSAPAPEVSMQAGFTAFKIPSAQVINYIDVEKPKFEVGKNVLESAKSKLTATEQTAIADLQKSAAFFTSDNFRETLQTAATVEKFSSAYVENFNILSQKQIRAIPLERLQPALAPTVRQESNDGRLEIFERLARLNISLGDLTTDFVDTPGTITKPPVILKIARLRFQTLITRRFDLFGRKTSEQAITEVSDADESKHFSTGVSYADMSMAALRAVEKRVKEYRAFVATCRATLKETQAIIARLSTDLAATEVELDEARQDVAVALAIEAEEKARIFALNTRRGKVLIDRLEFLVFCRPRAVKLNTDVPARRIEPALTTEPVIECLREDPEPPSDLAALRDIFSASPARWFKHAPHWIEKVDRWEHLRALLDRASRTTFIHDGVPFTVSQGRYSQTLGKVFQARRNSSQKFQLAAQTIVPASLVSLSWRDLQQKARQELTLGHLISAGPAPLAKAASEELKDLFSVATCLHENFSAVPGLVRLDWAERFGQFDNVSLDFRDLSRLPSWQKIDFTVRREMQLHADWLFGRIDEKQPDAIDLINDLIRVAMLLASHAPVDQLIVGQPLENDVTPIPGGILKLKVDPLRIRRGMDVTYKIADDKFLRAVVEDISSSHVAARIIEVPLLNGTPIHLSAASNFYFKSPAH